MWRRSLTLSQLPGIDETPETNRRVLAVLDAGRCFVAAPGEGRLIDLGDFDMRVKADAGNTRGVVSVSEATEPAGFGPPVRPLAGRRLVRDSHT